MPKLVKASWATTEYSQNPQHMALVRELMSLHCLCPESNQLLMNVHTGEMEEKTKNSALHWSRVYEWPWAILNSDLKSHHHVLDAGGGHGVFQYILARCCEAVVNLDLNLRSLEAVKNLSPSLNIGNLRTEVGDLKRIPFEDNWFDRVFCISVCEHIPEWKRVIDELFRVLKPGGVLILTMDIVHTLGTSKEFTIIGQELRQFLASYGAEVPQGGEIMRNKMPDGSILSAICLKFQK